MRRTPKNVRTLENIVEVSHLIMCKWPNVSEDSSRVRYFATDAALEFDRVESRLLKRAADANNYEWMDATEAFADYVVEGIQSDSAITLSHWARKAILHNGVTL